MSISRTVARNTVIGLGLIGLLAAPGCYMETDLEEDLELEEDFDEVLDDEKPDPTGEEVGFKDAKCEDVEIHVHNDYVHNGDNKDIKVVDFKYYDYEDSKWRNELTTNKIIGHGGARLWTKDLEYVGGEDIKIKVYFKYNLGGTSWSSTRTQTSNRFFCFDGKHKNIYID